jgi:signal transduction histidine kinase
VNPSEFRRSIRLRLALATAALTGILVAGALLAVYFTVREILMEEVDDRLQAELDELDSYHRMSGSEGLRRMIDQRSVGLAGHDGYYFFSEKRLERIAGNLPAWPAGVNHRIDNMESETVILQEGSDPVAMIRIVRMDALILDDGRHLTIGLDVTHHEQVQRAIGVAAVASFGAAVLVALMGGLNVSRRLLSRVEGMNHMVMDILAGRVREHVAVSERRDEFDEFAIHFNRLLDENDRLIERMQQFTNDVAHDLRTPLSRIHAHVESALAHPEDAARSQDALHALRGEINSLLDSFNALLRIAQIESRSLREQMGTLDLTTLARDAVELYQPAAEEAGLALESSLVEDVHITGDRHLLAQALTNLIDNAIKYGAGGDVVRVAVETGSEGATLVVEDGGPGIPEGDRERVLERFVRLDASRSQPGTGLGLAFVKAVADLHEAQLILGDANPGLRATLRFPAPRVDRLSTPDPC